LRYFLWMSTLSGKVQWLIIVAIFFGPSLLRGIARQNPWATPVIVPLALAIIAFALLTWVADPLFNLLLRVNRFGRFALSSEQVAASNWVGLCLVASIVLPLILLALEPAMPPLAVAACLLLILPVAATYRCPRGWPRRAMGAYTLALAAIALAFFGLPIALPLVPRGTVPRVVDAAVMMRDLFL